MMTNYSVSAYPKFHQTNSFEPSMLDLDTFESLLVIGSSESYTVVDEAEHRLYNVRAESCIEAVAKYIDFIYGMVTIYEWDNMEGGWCTTPNKDWASKGFNFEIDNCDWDDVVEI